MTVRIRFKRLSIHYAKLPFWRTDEPDATVYLRRGEGAEILLPCLDGVCHTVDKRATLFLSETDASRFKNVLDEAGPCRTSEKQCSIRTGHRVAGRISGGRNA